MAVAVRIRGDYKARRLRELAKRFHNANQTRRLLALAMTYDGGSRTEAAKVDGSDRRVCSTARVSAVEKRMPSASIPRDSIWGRSECALKTGSKRCLPSRVFGLALLRYDEAH